MYTQMASYLLIVLNELEMSQHSHNKSTGYLCEVDNVSKNVSEHTFLKETVPYNFRQQIFHS